MHYDNKDWGPNLTEAESVEYKEVYRRGSDLLGKHIDLHDQESVPSAGRAAELREGIRLLQRAVAILPASWPAHRSEERRVGKEGRTRRRPDPGTTNEEAKDER